MRRRKPEPASMLPTEPAAPPADNAPSATPAALPPPVPETVALAEALLADCRSGAVRAFAVAIVQADGRTNSKSAAPENDVIAVHLLNSGIATLAYAFQKAVVGEAPAPPAGPPESFARPTNYER